MNIEAKIESVLFFRSEPVTLAELAKLLNAPRENVQSAISNLQETYKDKGIVIVTDGESFAFGTHPGNAALIEKMQKEEFSRELGRAGLETLAVILYKGPISRREIDQIRGVNSGFILRTLLIRGLIERTESSTGERSFTYKPTLTLFKHLGVAKKEALPEYGTAWKELEEFVETFPEKEKDHA